MKLSIVINVGEYNGTMGIQIYNNNQVIYFVDKNILSSGINTIDLDNIDVNPGLVTIEAFGKNKNDTLVDENQSIIHDKYIDILNLYIDFFELKKYHLCHNNNFFETFFSKNEKKEFVLPDRENLLEWYLQILEDHNT